MAKTMLKIGGIIYHTRKKLQLSQNELAKRAGVTQTIISKVEAGSDVRLSTLEAIAKALNLSVVAVPAIEAITLRRGLSGKPSQSLLEQFEVKDDE